MLAIVRPTPAPAGDAALQARAWELVRHIFKPAELVGLELYLALEQFKAFSRSGAPDRHRLEAARLELVRLSEIAESIAQHTTPPPAEPSARPDDPTQEGR